MSGFVGHVLYLLQQVAYARVLCEFHRIQDTRAGTSVLCSPEFVHAQARLRTCEQRLEACRNANGDPDAAAAVHVARALYLRFLLSSAAARLQPWRDGDDLARMPLSHMFEWISYDFERLELATLEDAMTPVEVVLYARSIEKVGQ
jgi:hypothetical protein